jgi:hypothetical protein
MAHSAAGEAFAVNSAAFVRQGSASPPRARTSSVQCRASSARASLQAGAVIALCATSFARVLRRSIRPATSSIRSSGHLAFAHTAFNSSGKSRARSAGRRRARAAGAVSSNSRARRSRREGHGFQVDRPNNNQLASSVKPLASQDVPMPRCSPVGRPRLFPSLSLSNCSPALASSRHCHSRRQSPRQAVHVPWPSVRVFETHPMATLRSSDAPRSDSNPHSTSSSTVVMGTQRRRST